MDLLDGYTKESVILGIVEGEWKQTVFSVSFSMLHSDGLEA